MDFFRKQSFLFAIVASLLIIGGVAAAQDIPLKSWPAPSTWTPLDPGGRTALADLSGPIAMVPMTPCRQYDSRSSSVLLDNVARTVTLTGAPCGIPAGALAASVNITVFSITGAGSNGVFKVDRVSPPLTAWINYPPTETQRGNAGVVALTAGGGIVVQVNQGAGSVNFTVDVNGYYTYAPNLNSQFAITGNFNNMAAIVGFNYSNTDGSHGVGGWAGGTGVVHGVQGGVNLSAAAGASGVHGYNGASAVETFGVLGENWSTVFDAAGVKGVDYGGAVLGTFSVIRAGVRGDSGGNFGVLGVSNYKGVTGYKLNETTGVSEAKGTLAYKPGATAYAIYGEVGDFGGTGAKYFVEPHPTDVLKVIRYISLEGPESGTYFRGRAQTQNGVAVIDVPDHFRMVSDEEGITVHVTPVGRPAQTWVESVTPSQIVVRSTEDAEFHYIVHGVRRAFKNFNPVDVSPEFRPENAKETLPAGLPDEIRARLVRVGIYNPDGTVNMQTAERMGWAQKWREEEKAQAARAPKR